MKIPFLKCQSILKSCQNTPKLTRNCQKRCPGNDERTSLKQSQNDQKLYEKTAENDVRNTEHDVETTENYVRLSKLHQTIWKRCQKL